MGTLKPKSPFIPEFHDCPDIQAAFKGFGKTDEKLLIDLLANRSNLQRQQLQYYYKKMYDQDLYESLKGELKGDLWMAVRAMMMPAAEYDARELNRAMQGRGTDEALLIEILCTRTTHQIEAIKKEYKTVSNKELWEDIESDTSGEFKHILVDLCQKARDESGEIEEGKPEYYAKQLAASELVGEKYFFRELLATQSYAMLREIFREYQKLAGHSIEEAVEKMGKKVEKHYKTCCAAIVKCAINMPAYIAEKLHWSMKGLGTKDKTLVRLVVTRCEVDMVQVKEEFLKMYGKTLESYIADDTSGDYRKLLLSLVGSPNYGHKTGSRPKSSVTSP